MSWLASVHSTVSSDTEPTIVFTFPSAKYVFNTGENTVRSWSERGRSWRKTRCIFLTSIGTQRASGLPGTLMTLADASNTRLNITGPSGLMHFLAHARSYLYRENLYFDPVEVDSPMHLDSANPQSIYADENLTIYGVHLSPQSHITPVSRGKDIDSHHTVHFSGKRKRSLSPDSPSKRGANEHSQDVDVLATIPSLTERMKSSGFNPTALEGADAQEWRRLNVVDMGRPTEPSKSGKKKPPAANKELTGSAVTPLDTTEDKDWFNRPSFPHRTLRLPKFQYSRGQEKATLCYVCIGHRQRGKFDAVKAKELQIPNGPERKKLANGETITFMVDDGKGGRMERTVRPEECLGPSDSPKVVIVLDVPSPDHIPPLVSIFETSPFYSRFLGVDHLDDHVVHSIYHMCGDNVLEDNRYKSLLARFAPDVYHIIASREHAVNPITFTTSGYNQLRLSQLDAEMFPVPKFDLSTSRSLLDVPDLPKNTLAMTANFCISVRPPGPPKQDPQATRVDLFHPQITSNEPLALSPTILKQYDSAKETAASALASRESKPGDDVTVIPLGTGSAVPSIYRNVLSTLIQIPHHGNILLDAGEGTWGQLIRFFGDDINQSGGVWQVLRDLKCIFLSHLHGDHHIGTARILAMRQKLDPPPNGPLYVIGTHKTLLYLSEYNDIEDLGFEKEDGTGVSVILSDAIALSYGPSPRREPIRELWDDPDVCNTRHKQMCQSLGLHNFVTVFVHHRARCFGAVLQHNDGWSITFSGDTMPCNALVRAGEGSTLLIHEASMGDEDEQRAKAKAHSTSGQAIEIGMRMRAENILLTHFSARYPKMSMQRSNSCAQTDGDTVVALAFDHCKFRIGEMAKLRAYLPAIKQCLDDSPEEDDDVNVDQISW